MRMSTKGRYAVNAMIDLALRESAGPVPLAAIGARQQVSLSYLEQLFARLRQQGLVVSTRGPGGGYTLGRPADQISVADIVCTVDELADGGEAALTDDSGLSRELWLRLNAVLREHMATISLHSLVQGQQANGMVVELKAPRRLAVAERPVKPAVSRAPNSVFAFGRSFAR
ncbi:MAG: Rrf2 family transcriptional regulator [Chitinophagaceae bacterium]|nr:Rrf2 family transcriptional regulator [Rubrivivax sp.]